MAAGRYMKMFWSNCECRILIVMATICSFPCVLSLARPVTHLVATDVFVVTANSIDGTERAPIDECDNNDGESKHEQQLVVILWHGKAEFSRRANRRSV